MKTTDDKEPFAASGGSETPLKSEPPIAGRDAGGWGAGGGPCPRCNCTMDYRERDEMTDVRCWNCGYENSIGEDDE